MIVVRVYVYALIYTHYTHTHMGDGPKCAWHFSRWFFDALLLLLHAITRLDSSEVSMSKFVHFSSVLISFWLEHKHSAWLFKPQKNEAFPLWLLLFFLFQLRKKKKKTKKKRSLVFIYSFYWWTRKVSCTRNWKQQYNSVLMTELTVFRWKHDDVILKLNGIGFAMQCNTQHNTMIWIFTCVIKKNRCK